MLGFYGKGVTKVKVEYVGRAPLAGSDDRKLAATLRDRDTVPVSQVKVASADDTAPTYFDPRPMAPKMAPTMVAMSRPPTPPERPYALGEDERAPQPRAARATPTVELAAAARPTAAPSPVSAYAPVRYDGSAGFMSGRGLY
jgi:rare lipoprotein A